MVLSRPRQQRGLLFKLFSHLCYKCWYSHESNTSAATATITTNATATIGATGVATADTSIATDKGNCPKNDTVAVGAGVGASLGVALLISLALLGWREKTRPKVQTTAMAMGNGADSEMDGIGVKAPVQLEARQLYELHNSNPTVTVDE